MDLPVDKMPQRFAWSYNSFSAPTFKVVVIARLFVHPKKNLGPKKIQVFPIKLRFS